MNARRTLKYLFLSTIIALVKRNSGGAFLQIISSDNKQIKARKNVFLCSPERCWKRLFCTYSCWKQIGKSKALVPNLISLKSLCFINLVVCVCLSQEPHSGRVRKSEQWKRRGFRALSGVSMETLTLAQEVTHMCGYSHCTSSLNFHLRFPSEIPLKYVTHIPTHVMYINDRCIWYKYNVFLEIKDYHTIQE